MNFVKKACQEKTTGGVESNVGIETELRFHVCLRGNSPCFNGFVDGVYFLALSSAKFYVLHLAF